MVCAFGFRVGGLGLGWWARVGLWSFVSFDLALVGWGWSVVVCDKEMSQ